MAEINGGDPNHLRYLGAHPPRMGFPPCTTEPRPRWLILPALISVAFPLVRGQLHHRQVTGIHGSDHWVSYHRSLEIGILIRIKGDRISGLVITLIYLIYK